MEHTELPWNNPKYTRRDGNNACWIMDGGKRPKAICRCCGPNAEANAEYVVRACNAFPAMEALVEQYAVVLEEGHPQPINKKCDCVVCRVLVKAKAALAAGGE